MPKIPTTATKRISPEFRLRVLELMEEEELTKQALAERAVISNEVVSRITIYGIIPSLKTLIKLADYFNVSLPYLLAESDTNDFAKSESPTDFHTRMAELVQGIQTKYSIIAHKMPFNANYFYEWERTKTLPSLEYLEAIADYFHVSVDYLLGRTDYKN